MRPRGDLSGCAYRQGVRMPTLEHALRDSGHERRGWAAGIQFVIAAEAQARGF